MEVSVLYVEQLTNTRPQTRWAGNTLIYLLEVLRNETLFLITGQTTFKINHTARGHDSHETLPEDS